MSTEFDWLDSANIKYALLRHHLTDIHRHGTVSSAVNEEGRAVALVTENESDPSAPLVIVHGTSRQLVRQLLTSCLRPRQRYLLIVPGELRSLLVTELQSVEYVRNCLLFTASCLPQHRPQAGTTRVSQRDGCYAYRKLISGQIVSEARINWQTESYAEVGVYTRREHRGRGHAKDVVSALTQEILASGRRPLYVVGRQNKSSIAVCQALGYQLTGETECETIGRYAPRRSQRLYSRAR